MKTKILALILALAMVFTLAACGGDDDTTKNSTSSDDTSLETITVSDETTESVTPEDGSWAIYWYLCGSDLETNGGFATNDLVEMLDVELPENVTVVVQTGGSETWQNMLMDETKIQRWVYDSSDFYLVDEQESANMGDPQTLYDFLYFAKENYPADKTAVIFWNHGGGSVSGAAFDEIYGFDSLTLPELKMAFDAVWPANTDDPALELVGFDTCLMATLDTAATFQGYSKYFVASEELEPGCGWNYTGWIGALAANPDMDGAELGINICDAFYEGCEMYGVEDQVTLSVTDLTKLDSLLEAYEAFGAEALVAASEDPGFFAELGRAASQSENYGGNTREQGYANLVDLGHLARQTSWMLPSAQDVEDALDECIVYHISGQYRSESTGLSCYYSYNGDIYELEQYIDIGTGESFKHLYTYGLTGELLDNGEEYLASLSVEEMPDVPSLLDTDWDGAPLGLNDDGASYLTLGPEANDILSSIGFSLFYVDVENDAMMLLGTDNDITADWEEGIFYDNFRGVWGAIDGCLVYMELSFEGEDYNLYSVPILLNGEEYNLQVVYDFTYEEWTILGASKGIDDLGMASKELRLLEEGDVITTIWQLTTFSDDEDFEMYTVEEIVVTADTSFGETELFDGEYAMVFEMWDAHGNFALSDAVTFECIDGEIWTTVYED